MIPRGSGVILHFGGSGPHGIRVITLKTGGIPESLPDDFDPALREKITAGLIEPTLLNRAATLEDLSNVAAFVVSDKARSMTSTEVNISCGAMVD